MIHVRGVASATPQFPIFADEPGHHVFITTGLVARCPYRALLFWSSAMSIPDHISTNFDTPLRAASDGNLALMECTDAITGEPDMSSVPSGVRARTTSSRHLDISRTAIPTTPICRQPKPCRDNPQPDPVAVCRGVDAAVRMSTGKPFPLRLRRCVTCES
jgi:Family of unknown function (DUF6117)